MLTKTVTVSDNFEYFAQYPIMVVSLNSQWVEIFSLRKNDIHAK